MPSLSSIVNSIGGALYPSWGGSGWNPATVVIPGAQYNYRAEAGDLWANSLVAIAIKWLGDRFPKPRMQVNKIQANGKWKPVPNHDVEMLWRRPNEYFTRREMEQAIGLSLVADGNAYVKKVRNNEAGANGRARVKELWWMPHTVVEPTWEGGDFITRYKISIPGMPVSYVDREDMIHVRSGRDMYNVRKGCSPLKACLREICTVNQESGYTASILRNGGVPSIVLTPTIPELRPKKEDAESIQRAFAQKTRGESVGQVIVLGGMYGVEVPGFSPEQLALDKLTQNARAIVAGGCGVALMSIGQYDPGKTYSNLEEANKSSWGTVVAIQEMIGEAATNDLLPEFGFDPSVYAVSYDYGDVKELQESEDAVHKRTRDDFAGNVITQNEARDLMGMDKDPEGDRYFYEIQTSIALARNPQQTLEDVQAEAEGRPAPATSANGNGKPVKRWEY